MKKTDSPGIYFQEIDLLELSYKTNNEFKSELEMPKIEMAYHCKIFEPEAEGEQRTLISIMEFNLFKGARKWPFRLSLKFKAVFTADPESTYPLEDFSELQAPFQGQKSLHGLPCLQTLDEFELRSLDSSQPSSSAYQTVSKPWP